MSLDTNFVKVGNLYIDVRKVSAVLAMDVHIMHNVLGGSTVHFFGVIVDSVLVEVTGVSYTALEDLRNGLLAIIGVRL